MNVTPPLPRNTHNRAQEHAIMSDDALALQSLPPGPIVVLGAG